MCVGGGGGGGVSRDRGGLSTPLLNFELLNLISIVSTLTWPTSLSNMMH